MAKKKTVTDNSKKLEKAFKTSAKEVLPNFLKNTDIQILMPLEATLMRSDFSKVQLTVLLSIIEKLAYKIREVVDKRKNMKAGDQLSLFDEKEFLLNEKDEKVFRIKLYYKDVGVNKSHYQELESSIKALAGLPISLPFRSKDGREYQLFTNFCDVYVPTNQKKNIYCIVDFKQDVAKSLLKVDFGYHYVGKHASNFFGKCSKYCERIYWLIQGYQNVGSVTISTAEFRKRYGLEKTYKNFNSIRTKILDVSRDEIKKVFILRGCDCWFTYELIYSGKKKTGEPDQIQFIIHQESPVIDDKDFLDKQLKMEELSGSAEFIDILTEDLHITAQVAKRLSRQLTKDNYQAAINKAIILKAELNSGKEIKNPSRYILTSIGNFFIEYSDNLKAREREKKIDSPLKKWQKILESIGKGQSHATVEACSQIFFHSYKEDTKELLLVTEDITKITDEIKTIIRVKIDEYFGKDVKIKIENKNK